MSPGPGDRGDGAERELSLVCTFTSCQSWSARSPWSVVQGPVFTPSRLHTGLTHFVPTSYDLASDSPGAGVRAETLWLQATTQPLPGPPHPTCPHLPSQCLMAQTEEIQARLSKAWAITSLLGCCRNSLPSWESFCN